MHKFKGIFQKPKVFLPVIHVLNIKQALENISIAFYEGADGVWLISHTNAVDWTKLLTITSKASEHYSGFWIGVNCLDLDSETAIAIVPVDLCGLWTDNAGIREMINGYETIMAEKNWTNLRRKEWPGLYFGSVAFKYQQAVKNPAVIAKIATGFMDVVVTSGTATGQAPDTAKIRAIRREIGDFPLAVASGITPQNVCEYEDSVDCFMVATGISDDFNHLNPRLVSSLVARLN